MKAHDDNNKYKVGVKCTEKLDIKIIISSIQW